MTDGPNAWLIEEMRRRFLEDPSSVDSEWAAFFAGDPAAGAAQTAEPQDARAKPLTGAAARLAENMQRSLGVPTATSMRFVPASLLDENRRAINRHLAPEKVSFTHLIGWAVVRAIAGVPAMNRAYSTVDGKPGVIVPDSVNLGLAVDLPRADGTRALLVPNIKDADRMDFAAFRAGYEEAIARAREGRLAPDDMAGTTITLTNPGTIGTQLSVPRLMPGQGCIVGVGRVSIPSEWRGTEPPPGVGKVVGITSTYDHRVIQGAESGAFLGRIEELVQGEHGFYEEVFGSLGVTGAPVRRETRRAAAPLTAPEAGDHADRQARVLRLVNMFRVRGHLVADLNPLGDDDVRSHPELELAYHGLDETDLERAFFMDPGGPILRLDEILRRLRAAYCGTAAIEYMHIEDPEQKSWLRERVEEGDRSLLPEERRHILGRLNAADVFEAFLHTKYVGHKRYGLEGGESLIPMVDAVLEEGAALGVEKAMFGMPHRGRLNVLANVMGKPYERIFREFEGDVDPTSIQGSGDAQYHVGVSGKYPTRAGAEVEVELASNPSHLEAVDPVLEGMARAEQDRRGDAGRTRVLPILMHGDAAFAGEGVVAETLGMSLLAGFRTGGTVHIVVNNQLGFTTPPEAARSSTYATDVARMVQAPILHVNGDDPEACVWAGRLAAAYRQAFHRDVVLDLVCYRRHGHNEGDDPSYTQPRMYREIERHRPVRELYLARLAAAGEVTEDEGETLRLEHRAALERAFDEVAGSGSPAAGVPEPAAHSARAPAETGVARETLDRVLAGITSWPEGFTPHPKLARQLEKRRAMLDGNAVDWAGAEALAFGSLVLEGVPVRLSGQDARRGTFSQRHAVLVDNATEAEHFPLASLDPEQAPFRIYDSPLNEFGALGFEYGYSVTASEWLVLWEAQFGDFFNEAQVIIDQFLVAGEEKWGQTSGLVLLLPHGMEGQGPEHSSARIERFLEQSARDNMTVAIPTTPAQFFHLLRRQALREVRKPLIVFTPKSTLRLPAARSAAADLERGRFQEVLPDPRKGVRVAIVCAGKVFYDLDAARRERGLEDVAIVRLEQLTPFPEAALREAIGDAAEIRWVQEEPENMGAYHFVHRHLHRMLPDRTLTHVSRPENPSPATGSHVTHEREREDLLDRALAEIAG